MQCFDDLGDRVTSAWSKVNFDESRFAKICVDEIERRPPFESVDISTVIEESLVAVPLRVQLDIDSEFAEPPLTVYSHPLFMMSVLFWRDGTTAIHEHAFSGAFHVLHGSSILTQYDFTETARINENMLLGSLNAVTVEHLRTGSTRSIHSGAEGIHSLFHLEFPSATLIIRTMAASCRRPQYVFMRPNVAVNQYYQRNDVKRKRQLLELAHAVDKNLFRKSFLEAVRVHDFASAYLLAYYALSIGQPSETDQLIAELGIVRPELAALCQPVIVEYRTTARLVELRKATRDPSERFVLAVLLNAPNRKAALGLIESYAPGCDPAVYLTDSLIRMSARSERGGSVIDVPFDDSVSAVLRLLLQGCAPADLSRSLRHEFDDEDIAQQEEQILVLSSVLIESELFRRILRG
jgi:hypothetical protein